MLAVLASGALLSGSLWGCEDSTHHAHADAKPAETGEVPAETAAGLYRVKLRPEQEPIPMNAIHNWVAHVETSDGEAIESPDRV